MDGIYNRKGGKVINKVKLKRKPPCSYVKGGFCCSGESEVQFSQAEDSNSLFSDYHLFMQGSSVIDSR